MDTEQTVRALWNAYQHRDWQAARSLLADDAVMTWPCSGERFHGADAIVHVNAVYPEGWTIIVLECTQLVDGRVHSVVRVDHPPDCYFANSLFSIENDLIAMIDEYWATSEFPPSWRSESALPGHEFFGLTDTFHRPA